VGRYGQDEAEAMMGHQTGLNAIYARFDDVEERLEEVYKKSIPDLSINQKGIQVNEVLNNTIKELKEKIENNEKKRLDVYTKLVFITAKLEDLMIKDEKRTKEIEELKRDLHNWKMTVQDFEKIIHHLISKNRKLTAEEEE
jgi:chromosome segregation ATPase